MCLNPRDVWTRRKIWNSILNKETAGKSQNVYLFSNLAKTFLKTHLPFRFCWRTIYNFGIINFEKISIEE